MGTWKFLLLLFAIFEIEIVPTEKSKTMSWFQGHSGRTFKWLVWSLVQHLVSLFVFVMLRIKPRALYMLSEPSSTELLPQLTVSFKIGFPEIFYLCHNYEQPKHLSFRNINSRIAVHLQMQERTCILNKLWL
jgi:hypothetical protein